jgi:hypothetical protein
MPTLFNFESEPIVFLSSVFSVIFMILAAQTAWADQQIYRCNFVQSCDDTGDACVLSALRISVDQPMVILEHETAAGNRQLLIDVQGFDGLGLLTVGPSGQAKLSEHRGVETSDGRAISYHGVCR